MLEEFTEFMKVHALCDAGDLILLGVSGGVDSMVMSDLFMRAGHRVAIAHCNFQLRGEESDGDESLVRDLAEKHGLPFRAARFETRQYAVGKGISIQMAARELRMEWMEQLASEQGCTRIALAHHQDDEAETFFLNLMRGTGIAGLGGIRPIHGRIIRPMLFTGRAAIEEYAVRQNIRYRVDSTNLKTDYARNRIRHQVIPELERIKPGFARILNRNMNHIRAVGNILRDHYRQVWGDLSKARKEGILLDLAKLRHLPERETYLFEFLRPYGFNASDANQISTALDGQPGKLFVSASHRVRIDRESLLITGIADTPEMTESCLIREGTTHIKAPIDLIINTFDRKTGDSIPADPRVAHLDADTVQFPLALRRWQTGDRFVPLGMQGHKLLSDYFTDIKLSAAQKENAWVLEAGGQIIWVVGHRISDPHKITRRTSSVLEIRLISTESEMSRGRPEQ